MCVVYIDKSVSLSFMVLPVLFCSLLTGMCVCVCASVCMIPALSNLPLCVCHNDEFLVKFYYSFLFTHLTTSTINGYFCKIPYV